MARPISVTPQVHQAVASQASSSASKRRPTLRAVDVNALKQHSVNAAVALERPSDHSVADRIGRRLDVEEAALDTPAASTVRGLVQQLERNWEAVFSPPTTFVSPTRFPLKQRWGVAGADKIFISARGQSQRERRAGPLKRRRVSRPASAKRAVQSEPVDHLTERACRFLSALEDEFESGVNSAESWSARRTALDMHYRSMGCTRVLKKEEEGQLFAILNRACEYGLSRTEMASQEQLQAASQEHGVSVSFLQAVQSNTVRARKLLIRFNLRLIMATAKRVVGTKGVNMDFADLLPEGQQGLITAMLKFEPARGYKFSSYAVWYIRSALQNCIRKESRIVYVPAHVHDKLSKVLNAEAKLQEMRGQDAVVTDEAIADALGMAADKVRLVRRSLTPTMYLDDPALSGSDRNGDPSHVSLLESLTDDSAEEPHIEEWRDQAIHECLNAVLQTLQPRERNIIRLRYGLNTERRQVSRLEVADAYGLSQERIRQIEDDAVQKLMVPWRRQVLRARAQQQGALFDDGEG